MGIGVKNEDHRHPLSPSPKTVTHLSRCSLYKPLDQTDSCCNVDIFIAYHSLTIIERELRSTTLPF